MSDAGLHVFGIVGTQHPSLLDGLAGVGGTGAAVWRVAAAATAAIVCAANAQLRAKRRDLLAHQQTLERLWRQGAVLPMRFGVLAAGEEALRAELLAAEARHTVALTEVAGRGEVNVKLVVDEDLLVRHVAVTDPAVRQAIAVADGGYLARLRLGEAVAAAIEERTRAHADRMERELAPLSVRLAPDRAANTCSFLVDRSRMDEFLARTAALESRFWPQYVLRVAGPLPPYSFTEADRWLSVC